MKNNKLKSEIEDLEISISNIQVLIETNRAEICNLENNIDIHNEMLAKWSTELFVKQHERDCNV